METITLHNVLPAVFAGKAPEGSGIWLTEVEFRKGNSYLIEAESGRGKSSLCGYLFGYRRDYTGTIMFDGTDISTLSHRQWSRLRCTSLAMMLQDLRLFPELTATENIELKNHLTGQMTRERIDTLFGELGIAEKADTPVGKLSFGQQQRVAFVRMLCQSADFMILDEPVSHLDNRNTDLVSRLLFEEARRRGCGIIVTSIGKHFDTRYDKIYAL